MRHPAIKSLILALFFALVAPLSAASPSSGPDADPYRLPATSDAQVLVKFVNDVSQLAPEPNEDPAIHARKQTQAIRVACEQIRRLTADPASDARRFALRKLAELDLQALTEASNPARRDPLAKSVREYLNSCSLTNEDLSLLVAFAQTAERLQLSDAARDAYARFAPRLLSSKDPARKRLGELMTGALRRLECVGKPFVLSGETLDGRKFNVGALKNKVALVVFWSTSTNGSLVELLYSRMLLRDFQGKGFEVIGVSGDDDRAALGKFLDENPLPWPTLPDRQAGDLHSAIRYYGISALPTTFLLGRDGKVLAMNLRGRDLRRELIRLLGPAETRPIVSTASEPASSINDMQDRILDVGEAWLAAGKNKGARQLMAAKPPANVRGKWSAPGKQTIGDEEIYKRALKSVFVLGTMYRTPESPEWRASAATAFAVTADGVLSTSAHVFDFTGWEVGAMMAFNSAGEAFPVMEVLALDPVGDTCLFRIAAKGLVPLPLSQRVPVGARVRVVSHPGASVYYLSIGHVGAYEADERGVTWMHISAQFGEGSSGAPVFDEYGNVAGQVSQTSTLFSTPQAEPAKRQATRAVALPPVRRQTRQIGQMLGSAGEPQMVFRYCTPASRLQNLFAR